MRHLELAWSIRDAVGNAGDSRDVLVIVRARTGDKLCRLPEHPSNRAIERGDERRAVRGGHRVDDHEIAQLAGDARQRRDDPLHERCDLAPARLEALLHQESPVEHRAAPVGDARRLDAVDWLAPFDAVDVDRGVARRRRDDRHRRGARCQHRLQLGPDRLEHVRHRVDRIDAEKRHAAVRDAAANRQLEPVNAAMADADPVDVQRFRNDDVVGLSLRDPAALCEPCDACEAAAFLVDRSADLDRAGKRDVGPPQRFGREHRGGKARLHVADPTAVDLPVANERGKRVDGPACASRHDVGVAVQVNDRSARRSTARADDIHARIAGRVLGTPFGDDVFDVKAGPDQAIADQPRARFVRLAGRIDRGHADELRRERDDLVDRAIDLADHAVDDVLAAHRSPKKYRMPNCTSRPGR